MGKEPRIDTMDRRKAIDALARELAELFGRLEWDRATTHQRATWRAEATAIYLTVRRASQQADRG